MPIDRANAKWRTWAGYALSAATVLLLVRSAWLKLSADPQVVEQIVEHFGYPSSTVTGIGLLELTCVLVYALPHTATLGAVLIFLAARMGLGDRLAARIVSGVQSEEIPAIQRIDGLTEVESLPSFFGVERIRPLGARLPVTRDLGTKSYEVYLVHPESEQVEHDSERVRQLLRYS